MLEEVRVQKQRFVLVSSDVFGACLLACFLLVVVLVVVRHVHLSCDSTQFSCECRHAAESISFSLMIF